MGDLVEISEDNSIINIVERKNYLIRPIVANVDYMAIQFAGKNPAIDYEKINYLITNAYHHNIKPLIIINKIDCLDENEKKEIKDKLSYLKDLEIPLFYLSVKENIGIKDLETFLKNKITVIGGPSGVGKSSLINILQDERILETGEISERLQRGKHTTRSSNMMKLKIGGYIIDTPGFSSIEIPEINNMEELFKVFPEIEEHRNCKFLDCTHTHEPNCQVKNAVENKKISVERYNFYTKVLKILTERWNKYD